MERLELDDIEQRFRDVFSNILRLSDSAKIGLLPHEEGGNFLQECFTHILEELGARGTGLRPGLLDDVLLPRPTRPFGSHAAAAQAAWRDRLHLVKYGRAEHLRPAFQEGAVRIAPASSYNDPSLNPAMRDDELVVNLQPNPHLGTLTVFDRYTLRPKGVLHPETLTVTRAAQTNFYVYCVAAGVEARLFLDFDADSCLVITDELRFLERFASAVGEILPGWSCVAGPVGYYDPLRTGLEHLSAFFSKHLRYCCQKEYRVVWVPPTDLQELDPLYVRLGDLSDCTELVELGGVPAL